MVIAIPYSASTQSVSTPNGLPRREATRHGFANLGAGHVFVGRKDELGLLGAALEEARCSRSSVVLLEGLAGIGKTALVEQLLGSTGELRVLRATGAEAEVGLPFGIIEQLIDSVDVPLPPELTTLKPKASRQPNPLDVGAGLVVLLRMLQEQAPVVLVLDDTHWVDTSSLQAFAFACRRLRLERVLGLVLTRDHADPRLSEDLRRVVAGDRGILLRLDGLSARELCALATRLGITRLSVRASTQLLADTRGNPLHARALLEELPPDIWRDPPTPLPAPRSFARLVLGRLAKCPPDVERLVVGAAVLGTSCALALAGRLANVENPLLAFEQAIAARLLEEPWGTAGQISFPQPLIRAAVYHGLGPAERAALHDEAATLVEDEGAALRHRVAATTGTDLGLAGKVAAFARRQATTGAFTAAGASLLVAGRLTAIGAERQRLVSEGVEYIWLAGDLCDAAAVDQEVVMNGDEAQRCYALGRLAFIAGRLHEAHTHFMAAWTIAASFADRELPARIANQLGCLYILQGRGSAAVEWSKRAIDLSSNTAIAGHARFVQLIGLGIHGRAAEGLALTASLHDPATAPLRDLHALLGRAVLRTWTDDAIGARQDAFCLVMREVDSLSFRIFALGIVAQAEYRLGAWDDAVVHAELAVSAVDEGGQVWLGTFFHAIAAFVLAGRGLWEAAEGHIRMAEASTKQVSCDAAAAYAAVASGYLAAARGDPQGVVVSLEPLCRLAHRDGVEEPGVLPWQDLYVDALVDLGRHEEASAALHPYEAVAAERGRRSAMAAAARARANLEAARGHTSLAEAAFQAGLEYVALLDMPFHRALLQAAYGRYLRRAGRRKSAATQLEMANDCFTRLDARPYLVRCHRDLAACGVTPTKRRTRDASHLTPQQTSVARLVASGLSNREVAAELVVSVKTVEYHLSRVYAKLGVATRSQLVLELQES